jgi:hypothetical protein
MANILTHPTNGAIYFDDGTAGSSSVPALTGDAVSLNYDGSAGLNVASYNTTSTDRFTVDGDSGRLFSVNDSLTGTIFSVNDAAGLPIIEVESTSTTDTITMGTYASNALVVAGNRVGIGTASPGSSYKLDVTGDVNVNGDIVLGGKLDFTGNITAATSDTDVFVVIDAGELKTRTGTQVASDIGLGNVTNQSKSTMFTSPTFTGNVGIGTTSPSTILDVSGTGAGAAGINLSQGEASTISNRLFFSNGTANQGISMYNLSGKLVFGTGATAGSSSGDARMYLTNTGNLGIGTASPSSLLHLEAAVSPTLQIKDTTNNVTFKAYAQDSNSHLANTSNHDLFIDTNNASRITVKADGKVGINTGGSTLHNSFTVQGNANISNGSGAFLTFNNGDASITAHYNSSGTNGRDLSFKTWKSGDGNTEKMRIDKHGNVGIGTTSPSSRLHIKAGSSDYDGALLLEDNSDGKASLLTQEAGKLFIGYAASAASPNSASTIMVLENAGNVGIGTTSPTAKITLADHTTAAGGIKFRTAASSVSLWSSGSGNLNTDKSFNVGSRLRVVGGNAAADPDIGFSGASSGTGFSRASNDITFITSATERMRINSSGKVLVNGAHDNGGKADFAVDGGTQISLYDGQVQMGGADMNWNSKFVYDGQTNIAAWDNNIKIFIQGSNTGSASARDIYFCPQTSGTGAATERMRITGAGNVGIGTSSPSAKLDVSVTSGAAWMSLINGSETAFRLTTYNNGTSNGSNAYAFKHGLYYNTTENAAVTFYRGGGSTGGFLTFTTNSGSERMRITSAGNVGIGTTSPAQKLHVDGNVDIDNGGILLQQGYGTNFGVSGYDILMPSTTRLGIKTAGAERMSILNNGYVGIGVTTPSRQLVVANSMGLSGTHTYIFGGDNEILAGQDSSGYYYATGNGANVNKPVFIGDNNSYIRFNSGDSERMRITSSGRVGIGASSPTAMLEVTGNIDDNWAGRFENTNSGGYGVLAKIAGTSANERIFEARVGTSTKMLIDGTGNTTFSGKVDFQGDAAIEGGSGYGVFKGYSGNDNHFIAIRGIVANSSTLSITGGHQTTFVEHADQNSEGWYFKSKTSGSYREIARIDGLGDMYLEGNQRVFADNYHPNADTLTTARTIAGTSFNGSSNIDISYNNLTNKPTIPTNNNQLSNGAGYVTTNTTYSAGAGLFLSGTTFTHNDTSSQSSVNNSSGTVIQDVTLDTYGHITSLGSTDLDSRYYTETEVANHFKTLAVQGNFMNTYSWSGDTVGSTDSGWGHLGTIPFSGNSSYSQNGTNAENTRAVETLPSGAKGVVWQTPSNDAESGADGGWNCNINGVDSSKAYRSVIYFRKTDDSNNGQFYHGCAGGHTLNISGSANTNPYFQSPAISTFVQDRWYVSIGYIQPYQSSGAVTGGQSGVYDCTTGKLVSGGSDFMMKSGSTTQTHRTYLYYSSDPATSVEFYAPRFEELNGNEPSKQELINKGLDGLDAMSFHSKYDPEALTQLTESSDANDDKFLLWDESATEWKYMRLDDLQDSIDNNTTYSAGTGISLSGTTFSLTDTYLPLSGGTMSGAINTNGHNISVNGATGLSTTGAETRFTTAYGYIELGPKNTTWAHIYSSGPNFYFNKQLYVLGNAVWHAANDGSGSGLDADLLDGLDLHTGRNNEANKVVRTQGNGYLNTGWINTTSGDIGSAIPSRIYTNDNGSGDAYVRYADLSSFRSLMNVSAKATYQGREQSASDTNYWVGTMGWGSTDFETIWHYGSGHIESWSNPTNAPSTETSHWTGHQSMHYTNGSTQAYGHQFIVGAGNPAWCYLRGRWGTTSTSWAKMWNSANDGSGSGLDADKLDAQEGSYYLNYNNLTNKPTIPSAYSLPAASSSTRGGVKIGYSENGKNYPVEVSSEKMFVNVPWTDTNTDTNTTYSAGRGLDLSGTQFLLETDLRDSISYIGLDSNDYIHWSNNSYCRTVVNGSERLRVKTDGIDVSGVVATNALRTKAASTSYSLITRDTGASNYVLYVQSPNSGGTQKIVTFGYGSATAGQATEVFRIARGNVNVYSANLTVGGTITGTSKNFSIPHPTKEGKRLVHSCIEGPEVAVYFRGRSKSNKIEMPDYWGGLVDLDSMTVELTAIGPNQDLYVEDIADDGEVTVGSNTETALNYFYVVYGERKDIDKLEVEIDDTGEFEGGDGNSEEFE